MSELYGVPAYKLNTYKFNAILYSVTERVTFGTLKTAFFPLGCPDLLTETFNKLSKFCFRYIDLDFTNRPKQIQMSLIEPKNDLCLSPPEEGPLTNLFVKKLVMNYL